MNLRESLEKFHKEAVCPVRNGLESGFVAGAFTGWGWARTYVGRLVAKFPDVQGRAIPDDAICFFRDGNAWCATFGDFVNLQESPAGFGGSFEKAIDELKKQNRNNCPWIESGDLNQ